MSKKPKREGAEEAAPNVIRESVGRVTFLDPFGDANFSPPSDVRENSEGLVIRMEVPGVHGSDLAVHVSGGTVEVTGEKYRDSSGQDASYLCLERIFGKFRRVFELTGCLDMGGVKAELKDGILVIVIPKCEERRGKKRRIPITEL